MPEGLTGAIAEFDPLFPRELDLDLNNALQSKNKSELELIAAGIAHELGNPLSIINSSLQYLHERLAETNDPMSDFTMAALQNVERIHEVLRSMLDVAALKKSQRQEADLNELVSGVLCATSTECRLRAVNVEVSLDPELPHVWVDTSRVKQILLNQVRNALDAIAMGGDRLAVRTRLTRSRTRVVVEVENNGPPIPKKVLPRLFRPFFTTKEGGTGLGLYLSRQIARDHGGDLTVENLPQGVRFTLTISLSSGEGNGDGASPDCR